MYSDNGSNFKGAKNFISGIRDELVEFAAKESFNWSFIPPESPNFGGIWESGIKSAKKHLKSVTHGAVLTFEEYLTLFVRVEGVLNARPLCYTKQVSQENEVLTPAHFLYVTLIDSIKLPLSTAFQNLQNRLNSFRKLWTRDYLIICNAEINGRSKVPPWLKEKS